MQLSEPVKYFIEKHITLIEENDLELFFYNALFALTDIHSEELFKVFTDVLNINPEQEIKDALVEWCKDNVALRTRKKVQVSPLQNMLPDFGYDSVNFRHLFVEAVKKAYPNKTLSPDNYGIEYIVEKQ